MIHLHLGHRSPALVRLLLACAVSVALVTAIYLADLSLRQGGSLTTRARLAPSIAPAPSTAAPPVEEAGAVITRVEPPASTEPAIQVSPQPERLPRYTVKPGDSLIEIGLYFGARTEDLIALNALPSDGFLYAGQELIIPRGPVASPAAGR